MLSIRIIKLATFAKPVVDERSGSSIALLQSDCPKMLRAVAAGASSAAALVIVVRLRFFFFKQGYNSTFSFSELSAGCFRFAKLNVALGKHEAVSARSKHRKLVAYVP